MNNFGTARVASFGGYSLRSVTKKMSKWLKYVEEDTYVWDISIDTEPSEDGKFYGRIMFDGEWDQFKNENEEDSFEPNSDDCSECPRFNSKTNGCNLED
jgi:hypothetical protein